MESSVIKVLDDLDVQILDILQKDSQVSNAELARRVNLSPVAMHARIKRLDGEGFIDKQVAILNQEKLGFDLLCFIFMSTNIHQFDKLEVLEKRIRINAGSVRMSLFNRRVRLFIKGCKSHRKELEQFIRKLNKLGITRIQTSLALREIKYSTVLPIRDEEPSID